MLQFDNVQKEAFPLGLLAGQVPTRPEAYTWSAVYDDDTAISEYDREEGRGFAEVDQTRVKTLLLFPQAGGDPYIMDIPEGAQPVFFRRRSIEINLVAGESSPRPTKHCIGWKRGDEATYLFILEDGSTSLTNDLQAV